VFKKLAGQEATLFRIFDEGGLKQNGALGVFFWLPGHKVSIKEER
jgi:hypothetical protein